jgi:hypothetical protein
VLDFAQPTVRHGVLAAKIRVRFGIYDVSRLSGELRKAGVKVRVQRQPLKLLEKLLSARERSLPGRNCEGASGLEEGKFLVILIPHSTLLSRSSGVR